MRIGNVFKKNFIILMLAVSVFLTGCKSWNLVLTTGFEKNELMRINSESCYLPEMMLYLTSIQNSYEAVYGEGLWTETIDGVPIETIVKESALAKIAQIKVMNLMADTYGLELSKELEGEVKSAAEIFYASLNETERELMGVTYEDVLKAYSQYALANVVYDYIVKDVNPEISDDEARTISVQEILIKTYTLDAWGNRVEFSNRSKAEAYDKALSALELITEGSTTFEAVAARCSDSQELTRRISRGDTDITYESKAFALAKGEVSDIFETQDGYCIVKCITNFDLAETQKNKELILEERKKAALEEVYVKYCEGLTKLLNQNLYDSITMIHDDRVKISSFFTVPF